MSRSIKGMIGGHIFSEGKKDVDQTCGLFNATLWKKRPYSADNVGNGSLGKL